jgi:hypothetical protein
VVRFLLQAPPFACWLHSWLMVLVLGREGQKIMCMLLLSLQDVNYCTAISIGGCARLAQTSWWLGYGTVYSS